ncbi:Aste57867_23588 [Aphanomyces stellatus]|uniref:Aste57867_23588 protein n=1 Tax=Aphanomyces stellatus TaxID=120398 RepID=A0A485LSL6_9STRA|nr:hypothetical protein As57867_023516 [Aphanomyces stellatus]VFU00233.1 Aste57867_23588 [Aphanomyces stellatus]
MDASLPLLTPEEIAAHAPLSIRRVVLSLMSYFLFFTDIPRSGYGFQTIPYPAISTNQYSLYGPDNYRVAKINHNTASGGFDGLDDDDEPISSVDVWLYKFDTTSVGMRSLIQHFAPGAWDPCLAYKTTCATPTIDIQKVFTMLDNLMDVMVAQTTSSVMLRVESYLLDKVYDLLAPFVFQEKHWQTIRGQIFDNPANVSVCHASSGTMPFFCQLTWSNYTQLGGTPTTVVLLANYIQEIAQSYSTLDNQTLQLLVVENIVDFTPDTGGAVDTAIRNFEVVTLFRVQTCDGPCVTTTIEDYRFEGNILSTNAPTWYRTLRLLRFACGLLSRATGLPVFLKCIFNNEICRSVEIGSVLMVTSLSIWFPVALFVIAHAIDSPMVYQDSAAEWASIMGTVSFTPIQVMTIVTCHMRNVWLLCLLSKILLLFYPVQALAMHGVPGIRGYAFISASFLSIYLGIRVRSARSTELLQVTTVPPSVHSGLLKISTSLPCQLSTGGLWLDVKTLFFSGLFVLVYLRFKFKHVLHIPTHVPHSALVFGSSLLFSTSWFGSLLDPTSGDRNNRVSVGRNLARDRHVVKALMNLAWMTDPFLLIYVLWQAPMVHLYEHKATKESFLHPLPLKLMAASRNVDPEAFQLVGNNPLMGLPWSVRLLVE